MRVLFLDPWHAGSHAAFSTGWREHSWHGIEILSLPGHHWKWRMRHAAWTLARRARELDGSFDAVVATDMLDLAAWRGLAPPSLARLPHVLYFHENQLCFPDERKTERDEHFGWTNLLSAGAADAVWFNSGWHREAFLTAARDLVKRMPDQRPGDLVDEVERKSAVLYPGVDTWGRGHRARGATGHKPPYPENTPTGSDPDPDRFHLLWAARWEADKAPEIFFEALDLLMERGVDFRVSVVGGRPAGAPPCFAAARERLGERIVHWGWLEREDYQRLLAEADLFVSTARHEFFGLSAVEAAAAGCAVLLPKALAYPEVFHGLPPEHFHDGTPEAVARRVAAWTDRGDHRAMRDRCRERAATFAWPAAAAALDTVLKGLAG